MTSNPGMWQVVWFWLQRKLRFFAQPSYGEQIGSRLGRSGGGDTLGVSVGAEGEFTDKLTGTVQLGYQQQTSQMTGNAGGTPTVTLELEQLLGRRTLLTLAYTRRNQVNIDAVSVASVSDSIRLSLSQALGNRQKWFASIFASLCGMIFRYRSSDQALSGHLLTNNSGMDEHPARRLRRFFDTKTRLGPRRY